ncbi:hypothetical protein BN2537_11845 [Streptomyces venezuelae]|nr:hypothetical protein BN2537_11845 [Streptomyces venezuelae]
MLAHRTRRPLKAVWGSWALFGDYEAVGEHGVEVAEEGVCGRAPTNEVMADSL